MTLAQIEYMNKIQRLENGDYLVDVCDEPILPGEMYYETINGLVIRPDNVGRWKDMGDIVQIMGALGKLDELGEAPYDYDVMEEWENKIFDMTVDEFMSEMDYEIHWC